MNVAGIQSAGDNTIEKILFQTSRALRSAFLLTERKRKYRATQSTAGTYNLGGPGIPANVASVKMVEQRTGIYKFDHLILGVGPLAESRSGETAIEIVPM